jgi:hypothetical protein
VSNENYNNVTFSLGGTMNVVGTMNVLGTLTANQGTCCQTFNGGTIAAKGDITLSGNGFSSDGGTTVIKVAGSGTQTITGSGVANFPNLTIASSGTVNFSGKFTVIGSYAFTSGTLNAGTSTVVFTSNWGSTISVGSETYNNVTFAAGGNINLSGTMNVAGTLIANQTNCCTTMNGGTVSAQGNVTLSGNGFADGGGTTVIKIAGSGNQTITGAAGAYFPNLTIASTGGTVTFSGTIGVLNSYNFTSGVLDAGTSTLIFASAWGSTITVGSETYNNVTFTLGGSVTLSGTMNVAGTLTANEANCCSSMNGGTISAQGNVSATLNGFGMNGGTTVIKIAGSTSQTITGTSVAYFPNLTIASTGGTVSLSGTVAVKNATSITSGTTSLASSSDKLTTASLALNSNTLTKNGGTLVVNGTTVGTGSLYGGTVSP